MACKIDETVKLIDELIESGKEYFSNYPNDIAKLNKAKDKLNAFKSLKMQSQSTPPGSESEVQKQKTKNESTLEEEIEYFNSKKTTKGELTQKSQLTEYVNINGDTRYGIIHKMLDGTKLVYSSKGSMIHELTTGSYIDKSNKGSFKKSMVEAITILKSISKEKEKRIKEKLDKEGIKNKNITEFMQAGIRDKVRDIKISEKDLNTLKKENDELIIKTGVVIKWIENDNNADFNYDTKENSVTYVKGFNDTITTVLQNHELKHALTFKFLKDRINDSKVKELIKSVNDFKDRLTDKRYSASKVKNKESEEYLAKTNDLYERVEYMLEKSTSNGISDDLRQVSEIVAILSSEKDIREQFLNEFKDKEKSRLKVIIDWIKSKLSFKEIKTEYSFSPKNIIDTVDTIVKQSKQSYKQFSKDDIEAAKDIMSNNKKECE